MLDEREPRSRDERSLSPQRINARSESPKREGEGRRASSPNDQAHAAPSAGHTSSSAGHQRPVIFVNNLSINTENRDLEEIFAKFGKLTKVSVMYDPHTRESRGFAFLDYETLDDALNAVEQTRNITLHGREIKSELAKRGRPRTPTPGRYYGHGGSSFSRGGRYDPYPRGGRSPDRGYRRRGPSPPRSGDRYPSYGSRDPYPREPYPPRGYDRRSPPPARYSDRRSPPRGYGGAAPRYDRY